MHVLLAALAGLVVGSFLNVVILRGARGEGLGGRSRCETCLRTLSLKELTPIISFLIQRGKCLNCHTPLSWQYPVVETGTAVLYAIGAWAFNQGSIGPIGLAGFMAGSASAIVIFVSDLRYKTIPTLPVLIILMLGLGTSFSRQTFLVDFSFAFAAAALFAVLWFFSRGRWMGLGDSKLVFAFSVLLGYPLSLPALLFAFWLGGAVGIFLILLRQKTISDQIPFGPFIILGAVLAYFWGQRFLEMLFI